MKNQYLSKIKDISLSLMIFLFAMIVLGGCKSTAPKEEAFLPIRMDLSPAQQLDIEINRVVVKISKGDFQSSMELEIEGHSAHGTFVGLNPGIYAIDVMLYSGNTLVATGQGTAEVLPGETSTVYINLQFVPGGLDVIIGWGTPFEQSRRILFLGNSLVASNSGVDLHLEALLRAANPEWDMTIMARAPGSYTLQTHFNDPQTRAAIQSGDWDLVILQEQSVRPVIAPELFYQYADSLNTMIRAAGAQTAFYMTWARGDTPEMYIPLRDAYRYIGAYLDAPVIPAGVAFHKAEDNPQMPDLISGDQLHPTLAGTYLVSCLMMAKIWAQNPYGNSYIPSGLSRSEAVLIQQLAWESSFLRESK